MAAHVREEATVVITNAGTNGYVVIDAVQLLPVNDYIGHCATG